MFARLPRSASRFCLLFLCMFALLPMQVHAEGSGNLYPDPATGYRANIEWRTSTYGSLLKRRTLFYVYANAGEHILVASSAVGVNSGNILIYDDSAKTGNIGEEVLPAPLFNCNTQRTATGNAALGRITSRAAELAGPDAINNPTPNKVSGAGTVPNGYVSCFYTATKSGLYNVVFLGAAGDNSDAEKNQTSSIGDDPGNFNANQGTSVAVWDITVRSNLADIATTKPGRAFVYYLAALARNNGYPNDSMVYVVTKDGFRYKISSRGMDPYGWISYANKVGFLDSDGTTPLYRDVIAVPTLQNQEQNQLIQLQGDAKVALPEFPMFLSPPDDVVLEYLNIPTVATPPVVSNLEFVGPYGSDLTTVGAGGTFTFVSDVAGIFELVISRDGVDFEPTNPLNKVYRADLKNPGPISITWNGRDNEGQLFPTGDKYKARTFVHGGEVHFPSLDVENSLAGGPTLELLNAPGNNCFQFNGRCTGAFYDDRGYRTANGTLVGQAVNGSLCPVDYGLMPNPLATSTSVPYDSAGSARSFGFAGGAGNSPGIVCDSNASFGDKKGLDKWTYYPGNAIIVPLRIATPSAITLTNFAAQRVNNGVSINWSTTSEIGTLGYYVLRSDSGNRADSTRITPTMIRSLGGPTQAASYNWLDTNRPAPNTNYWLEEVTLNGEPTIYGPVRPSSTLGQAGIRFYLPLVGDSH